MESVFYIDLPNWQQQFVPLKVVAEIDHAEPDVGIFGNGSVAVQIVRVFYQGDNIISDLSEDRIEDIAHIIYDQLQESEK
jgi:hypothetical protein